MNESIYTAKLLARGHTVPEGLEAAVMITNRVHYLMETDFAVSAAGGEAPADRAVVVHSDGGRIDRVTLHRGTAHADPSKSLASSVPYTVSTGRTMLLTAVCDMWAAEAQIILVSRDPDSRRAEDMVVYPDVWKFCCVGGRAPQPGHAPAGAVHPGIPWSCDTAMETGEWTDEKIRRLRRCWNI